MRIRFERERGGGETIRVYTRSACAFAAFNQVSLKLQIYFPLFASACTVVAGKRLMSEATLLEMNVNFNVKWLVGRQDIFLPEVSGFFLLFLKGISIWEEGKVVGCCFGIVCLLFPYQSVILLPVVHLFSTDLRLI